MRTFIKFVNRKKLYFIGGAFVVVLGVGAFLYWGNRANAEQYMTAKVERGNLRNTVTATERQQHLYEQAMSNNFPAAVQ